MAAGCRDCRICTESAATGCVMSGFRMLWWMLTFWNIGLLTRRCPQCRHPMSVHARRADGSLKD